MKMVYNIKTYFGVIEKTIYNLLLSCNRLIIAISITILTEIGILYEV